MLSIDKYIAAYDGEMKERMIVSLPSYSCYYDKIVCVGFSYFLRIDR